jgi:ABC-type branched-subunit amino acid transport system substrate-binding protein
VKNQRGARLRARGLVAIVSIIVLVTLVSGAAAARIAPHSQATTGFDGKTIRVAGLTFKQNFSPDAEVGAQARFAAANKNNELKGVKIDYVDTGDDKSDSVTSVNEARRLVEQEGVFAIVPMVTSTGPGTYMNQKQVPYFGWGFDSSYCGPGDKLYGFGFDGCVLPPAPKAVPAFSAGTTYKYLAEKTGSAHPTIATVGYDSAGGKTSIQSFNAQATGSGLKVVWAKTNLPAPPAVTGDYSPFVQQLLASNGGKGPDAVWLPLGFTDALGMVKALQQANYKGTIIHSLYSDLLLKPMADTVAVTPIAPFEQHSAGTDAMVAAIKAYKPDAKPSTTMAVGYFSADFFVKAVKKLGTKNLTRQALQKTAAHMTYGIPNTIGPTQYPRGFQALNTYCAALVTDADGSGWAVGEPYTCTNKFFKVKGTPTEIG